MLQPCSAAATVLDVWSTRAAFSDSESRAPSGLRAGRTEIEIERTGRSAEELVNALADSQTRVPAYFELDRYFGSEALPAIREGLAHGNWLVRKWSAMYLDHHADAESLEALVPLLRDEKNQVRLWAVHSISCETCKLDANPTAIVPLLIERIELDESVRVRRMAAVMLATQTLDARVVPIFERILADEEDRKLRLHAKNGLTRYRELGLGT